MDTFDNARWLIPLLIMPTLMVLMATLFYYNQPKQINRLYGYRTGLSMKNQDTWMVANRIASECFLYSSMGFMGVLLLLLLLIGKANLISWFGNFRSLFLSIVVLSTGLLLLPLVVTEYKLSQLFTSTGVRK
ncbi:SdpI family protein [Spirosoma humi]